MYSFVTLYGCRTCRWQTDQPARRRLGSVRQTDTSRPDGTLAGRSWERPAQPSSPAPQMPPSNAPQVAATRASGLPADGWIQPGGPGYPSRPTTTSTDGVGYALCALAFEVVLSRRVNDEHRPSPFELIVLALGVALGLAALGWWCSPGTSPGPVENTANRDAVRTP